MATSIIAAELWSLQAASRAGKLDGVAQAFGWAPPLALRRPRGRPRAVKPIVQTFEKTIGPLHMVVAFVEGRLMDLAVRSVDRGVPGTVIFKFMELQLALVGPDGCVNFEPAYTGPGVPNTWSWSRDMRDTIDDLVHYLRDGL